MIRKNTAITIISTLLIVLVASGCVYSRKAETNDGSFQQAASPPSNLVKSAATLGQGDVFEVRVYKEPDLTSIYRVTNKGTIHFPLIGDVMVDGRTVDEVEREIRNGLEKDYLNRAYVSIFVKEFNSKKVFVFGQVKKPGTFPFEDSMRIIQAITLAGGFTPRAAKNSVSITRIVDGSESRIDIEVEEIWKGRKPNLQLKPGDIIFIPEALF